MAGHIATAKRRNWCTPQWLVDAVREALGGQIDLDPCSNKRSIVGAKREFRWPRQNGLRDPWVPAETVYVNPPFGRGLAKWVKLCNENNALWRQEIILLLPAAVDTRHWQQNIATADRVCCLRGRVKYLGAKACAPFATALAYWGPHPEKFVATFEPFGIVYGCPVHIERTLRGRQVVRHGLHKPAIAGSIPAPATSNRTSAIGLRDRRNRGSAPGSGAASGGSTGGNHIGRAAG
jgi:hypothetical protein